jgi:hypothetical protein
MKQLIKRIGSLTFNQYFFLLIILGYLPIFLFGYFIQDDFGVVSLHNKEPIDALKYICSVNNNRPLSCVYHTFLTRLPSIFQFYFFFTLLLYIFFIFNVVKIFDFIIDDIFLKKLFITFLIFPFFSYTVLYSPAMQSMGVFALVLWSISLLLLKQFITNNSKTYLFISYVFILLMFLTYESPAPLLGLSIFFPLFFKKKIKLFYINFLIIIFLCILMLFMQKVFFPKIFNADLSRLKIDIKDYKKIIYLIFINLVLTVNIVFFSVEIAFKAFLNLFKNVNYPILFQISLIIFVFYKNFYFRNFYKKNRNNKYLLLIIFLVFISVIFLNAAMHALANTGLEFTKYNNRALVSVSFIFSLIIVFVYKLVNFNNKKLFNFILICLFSVPIVNFIYFQNNLIKERFDAQYIYNEFLNPKKSESKTNNINFILGHNRYFVDHILSYHSFDYFNYLNKNLLVIFLSEQKFCNINYYDEYINIPYLQNSDNSISVYNFEKFPYRHTHVIHMENVDSIKFRYEISNIIKCNYKLSNVMSKELNKEVYIDSKYDGYFLKIVKYFYFKFL